MKSPTLVFALMLGCNVGSSSPDVILVTVDTLRRDHVGVYNPGSPAETPNIDALAADGVTYTDAFSPVSVTGPAFVSMMTGLEPGQHGVMTNLFRGGEPLSDAIDTLAERFRQAEYSTGAFVSAFTLRQALGLRQGFDVYNGGEQSNREGEVTTSNLAPWLTVQEGRVFAWAHLFDAHGPFYRWLEPGDSETDWERDPSRLSHIPQYQRIDDITDARLYQRLYARGVEYADNQVGVIIDHLKRLGRYDGAIIVLVADHGESFEERELWYDHGTSAHAEQTQIPLIIKWPKGERGGTKDPRLASLLDVAPTVLEGADLPALGDAVGRSLWPSGNGHEIVYSESSHCKRIPVLSCWPAGGKGKELAVRTPSHSLVSRPQQSGTITTLYDRSSDSTERSGLPVTSSPKLSRALSAFQAERRGHAYSPLPKPRRSGEDEKKLRQLGYLE